MCVFCGPEKLTAGIVGNKPLCAHCWNVFHELSTERTARFVTQLEALEQQEQDLRKRIVEWAKRHA